KANIKHHDPRPGDPLKLYADASKAKNVLGWQSKHNLKSGLENTVQYFINYWEGNS
ncbi:MAG: UDP-glucose 4-epimerase, partial [Candidatus Pacebacteria bacterium]|nr:UDP-glucose 4-epimerase [Candidatus Paceibacterota bacterium]MBT7183963.1 UDP-glucose 4-epimerase [Candidatus Paceibacterota bacterium]